MVTLTEEPDSLEAGARAGPAVTFLFTDIEESTRLWEERPDVMRPALARHDALLRSAIESNDGHVFKTVGDAFYATFEAPAAALSAALTAQQLLAAESVGSSLSSHTSHTPRTPHTSLLGVRIALHTGVADHRDGDYFGPAVNRVARLVEVCHGGQVILSGVTGELVQDDLPPDVMLADLGRHRLRGIQRSERVFQLLHPALPAEFPPLSSLETFPNNLPHQVTRFIGREMEIDEVRRRLEGTRLLTVTGPGGTGKTRLSIQVAAALLEDEPDGVWLVELAGLSDPSLVPQAVGATLGVREAVAAELRGELLPAVWTGARPSSRSLLQMLVEHLRSARLLLVLDNCEHLLEACAGLADELLRSCPGVRILATSRERLNVPGETALQLPSLPESDAIRLFEDRAAAIVPAFKVTEQNAPLVAQVCSRLDGIPLAIEMAAARVRALPLEKIHERLDDRFRLLTSGTRTAPVRQQTLRALIDWSYDLLSASEQALLRRLSVFSGGWTLEAAEAVCGGIQVVRYSGIGEPLEPGRPQYLNTRIPEYPDTGDILDLLTSLVEKSLVQYEEEEGEGRYRLPETVRQYGRERLPEGEEADLVRERHCDWCLSVAEAADAAMSGPDLFVWLDRLDAEHDNMRAALEWSTQYSPEKGLRLAAALWSYWVIRGHLCEGRERLMRVLAAVGAHPPTPALTRALVAACGLSTFQWDPGATGDVCEASLAAARAAGSSKHVALSLMFLGLHHLFDRSDPVRAAELAEESVRIARDGGEKWVLASCLDTAGLAALKGGDLERAERLLNESLFLFRQIDNRWLITFPLIHLGFLAICRGDYRQATALGLESLGLHERLGDRWGLALSLEALAAAASGQGQADRAARLLSAAEALFDSLGACRSEKGSTEHQKTVAAARDALGEAEFTTACAEGRAMKLPQLLAYAVRHSRCCGQ